MKRLAIAVIVLATLTSSFAAHAQEAIEAEDPPDPETEEPKIDAGWDPEGGFILASPDRNYLLRVGFQAGIKAELLVADGDSQNRSGFFVLRPTLSGNIAKPWIRYWFSMELAANPPFILDAYAEIQPWDTFGLRVGQQYTPFSRHEYYGPQQILFPEWSPVANYFWSGRDKGLLVYGGIADHLLDYYVGIFSGTPLRQFTNIDGNYEAQARVTVSPLGEAGVTEFPYIVARGDPLPPFRVSFTANGYYGKIQRGVENFNPSTFTFEVTPEGESRRGGTFGADVFVQGGPFVAFGEAYVRKLDPTTGDDFTSTGAWGQVGMLLVPRWLDVGIRAHFVDPSRDVANDRFRAIEGQFALYVDAQRVVLKTRYAYGNQQAPDVDPAPAALVIPPGDNHLATLQLNLMF
jgi:hypothetical protein